MRGCTYKTNDWFDIAGDISITNETKLAIPYESKQIGCTIATTSIL